MSNFQRTKSKVWWGNSPLGSPLPRRERNEPEADEEVWEPQLPRWAGEEEDQGAIGGIETPPFDRHSSPNSHKSQDSGFSDSDSSPQQPQPQVQTPPHNCQGNNQKDQIKTPISVAIQCSQENSAVREVLKTPRGLHNYLSAHCDVGHAAFESIQQEGTPGNAMRMIITPQKNVGGLQLEKCCQKKNLFGNWNKNHQTNKLTDIEYIQVAPHHAVEVSRQPGIRSPLGYVNRIASEEPFQRKGLNRSFHFTHHTHTVDLQDSEEEASHSLGYIEIMKEEKEKSHLFSSRNISNGLHSKGKHKSSKARQNKGFLNLMRRQNESTDRLSMYGNGNGNTTLTKFYKHQHSIVMEERSGPGPGPFKTSDPTQHITPPLQFQDHTNQTQHFQTRKNAEELYHSNEELCFSEQDLSGLCTSTPKSVVPDDVRPSNMKPVNLMQNFNESLATSYLHNKENENNSEVCATPLEFACHGREAPLQQWLCSLIGTTEGEIGTLLQSKPIGHGEQTTISHTSNTITGNIRKVHTHALIMNYTAQSIIRELESRDVRLVKKKQIEISSAAANMNDFIMTHSITLKIKPPRETPERWSKISTTLEDNIQKAEELYQDINIELNESNPETNVLRKHFISLFEICSETTKAVLMQQMRTLVGLIEDPPSDTMLKSTLTSLGQLGRCSVEDQEPCYIPLVQCGVPRALLELIIHANKSSIKALSLRALATICTNSEAVEQFDQAGGLEIVCEVLAEQGVPEPQIREGVTVLAQVTAPWLEGQYLLSSLHCHLDKIVKNLTRILSKTMCCQLLLLCTAALVNVVRSLRREGKGSVKVISVLRDHNTLNTLLEAVKGRGPNASIFLQEQSAALMDLISCCAGGRVLIVQCSASCVALLCFLRPPQPVTPHPSSRTPLQQAELRLLTHSAQALARLCTIPEVCEKVIELEGPSRLVRVILSAPPRDPLVPLIRALRSLHHSVPACLPAHLHSQIQPMLHLPLMDAVSYYQHKADQESYV